MNLILICLLFLQFDSMPFMIFCVGQTLLFSVMVLCVICHKFNCKRSVDYL